MPRLGLGSRDIFEGYCCKRVRRRRYVEVGLRGRKRLRRPMAFSTSPFLPRAVGIAKEGLVACCRFHLGDQRFFEPLLEQRVDHRTGQEHRREDSAMRGVRNEGLRHPMPARRLAIELFALAPLAVDSRHRRRRAGLVDEDQPGKVQARLSRSPQFTAQGNIRPVLLGRVYRFFSEALGCGDNLIT